MYTRSEVEEGKRLQMMVAQLM